MSTVYCIVIIVHNSLLQRIKSNDNKPNYKFIIDRPSWKHSIIVMIIFYKQYSLNKIKSIVNAVICLKVIIYLAGLLKLHLSW